MVDEKDEVNLQKCKLHQLKIQEKRKAGKYAESKVTVSKPKVD